jgi:hypothetical protein
MHIKKLNQIFITFYKASDYSDIYPTFFKFDDSEKKYPSFIGIA